MNKLAKVLSLFAIVVLSACDAGGPASAGSSVSAGVGRVKDVWLNRNQLKGVVPEESRFRQKNIYLVLDGSGSMTESYGRESKMVVAKKAIGEFGKSIPADTALGLAVFDGSGLSERVPLGLNNRDAFFQAVQAVAPNGGTPLSSAVRLGYEQLQKQGLTQLGYGEYHLVIVTDGEANNGYDPTGEVNVILAESPIVIHTIGMGIGQGHSLNQPGRVVYKEANNPKDLQEGLAEILAESDKF